MKKCVQSSKITKQDFDKKDLLLKLKQNVTVNKHINKFAHEYWEDCQAKRICWIVIKFTYIVIGGAGGGGS